MRRSSIMIQRLGTTYRTAVASTGSSNNGGFPGSAPNKAISVRKNGVGLELSGGGSRLKRYVEFGSVSLRRGKDASPVQGRSKVSTTPTTVQGYPSVNRDNSMPI